MFLVEFALSSPTAQGKTDATQKVTGGLNPKTDTTTDIFGLVDEGRQRRAWLGT
jgi:hypothetical protein